MENFRRLFDQILRVINAITLAFLTGLTVWQVLTRYLLHNPSTWSEELGSYMFTWTTLLAATYIFGQRDHMNIPVLLDRWSPTTKKWLAIFAECLALAFAVGVLIFGGLKITALTMGQQSSSLGVPMGYFYAILPVTGVLTAIYNIINIVELYQGKLSVEAEDVLADSDVAEALRGVQEQSLEMED